MSTPIVGETRLAPGGATWRVSALQGKNTVLTGPGSCRSVRIERSKLVTDWDLANTAQPVTNAPSQQAGSWILVTREEVQQYRERHGASRLAEQLNVSAKTIDNWTANVTAPGHETQIRLVELLAGRQPKPRLKKSARPAKKSAPEQPTVAAAPLRLSHLPLHLLLAKTAVEIADAWSAAQSKTPDADQYLSLVGEIMRALI